MKKYNIAVVGATGMVGRKFLEVLEERKLPAENYYLFASKKSAGDKKNQSRYFKSYLNLKNTFGKQRQRSVQRLCRGDYLFIHRSENRVL